MTRPPVSSALLGALALLLAFLAGAVPAQPAGIVINIAPGFDGYYRPGRWCPIAISIQNQPRQGRPGDPGLDFKGTFVVESRSLGDDSPAALYTLDVSVPSFSRQRVVLYAKFPETLSTLAPPTIRLREPGGKLVWETPLAVQPVPLHKTMAVTVSPQITSLAFPRLRGGADFLVTGKLSPLGLFGHWAGYDSADMLVFSSWEEAAMRPEVQQALADWTAAGGTLVFLGGVNTPTYGAAAEAPLLPALPAATMFVEATGGGFRATDATGEPGKREVFSASKLQLRDGAQVLLRSAEGEPLMARRQYGNGQVITLAFDLMATSPNHSALLARPWLSMVPLPNAANPDLTYERSLFRGSDGSSGLRILTSRNGRPPNYIIIGLICVAYAVVVGPVNFRMLARRQRYDLAWFTVPAIVIVFAVLIYGFGRLTRGGQSLLREVTLVRGTQGQSPGAARTTAALFTPSETSLKIVPRGERSTTSDDFLWNAYTGPRTRFFDFGQMPGDAGLVLSREKSPPQVHSGEGGPRIRAWDLRPYELASPQERGPADLAGGIEAEVELREAMAGTLAIHGAITNRTGRNFTRTMIMVGDRGISLGALKDGATVALPGDDRAIFRAQNIGSEEPYAALWPHARTTLQELGTPELDADKDSIAALNAANSAEAARAYLFPPQVSERLFPPMRGVVFVGFAERTESAFAGIETDEASHAEVVVVRLAPQIPAGTTLPPEVCRLGIVSHPTDRVEGDVEITQEGYLYIRQGEVILSSELPSFDPATRVARMMLSAFDGKEASRAWNVTYSLYNFTLGRWEAVAPGTEVPGETYSLPGSGRAFIRIECRARQGIPFTGEVPVIRHVGLIKSIARQEP